MVEGAVGEGEAVGVGAADERREIDEVDPGDFADSRGVEGVYGGRRRGVGWGPAAPGGDGGRGRGVGWGRTVGGRWAGTEAAGAGWGRRPWVGAEGEARARRRAWKEGRPAAATAAGEVAR